MATNSVIAIVDDDQSVREGTRDLIEAMGFVAGTFDCAEKFLESNIMDTTESLAGDVGFLVRVSRFRNASQEAASWQNCPAKYRARNSH